MKIICLALATSAATAAKPLTTFEGQLRYTAYGGAGCDERKVMAQGTTTSVVTMAPGTFCETDVLDVPKVGAYEANTKWVVNDCDGATGRATISFHQCQDSGCGDCSAVPRFTGYLDRNTLRHQIESPRDPSCFAFTGMTAEEKEQAVAEGLGGAVEPRFAADGTDSFTVSQEWDAGMDDAEIARYWDVIFSNSCVRGEVVQLGASPAAGATLWVAAAAGLAGVASLLA